ncbi:MAG: ATP-binding protein [Planctomycetaceae bacterium]
MSVIRFRFLIPAAIVTLILTVMCIVTALLLFEQQSAMTSVLRENVTSRRAAVDLEECLYDISTLLRHDVDQVSPLNDRLVGHLKRLREVADQPEERDASEKLETGLQRYLEMWEKIPPREDTEHPAGILAAVESLEVNLIKPCQSFRLYNGRRIEESTVQHESVLGRLAWGMASIGVLGGIAGIVLGFGLTRTVGQSIRRLQVRIQDAAGKLSREPEEIIITEDGQFSGVHAQLDQLTHGIERMLSNLREREREVLRSEQLAAVGQLAASVAHEIRNPLTSIKMLVQTALDPEDASSLTQEDLKIIEKEVRRMESSLRTFLDFTRPPKLQRRQLPLMPILQEVAGLIRGRADKQGVSVRLEVMNADVSVFADPEQLKQVLVNLMLNGLDAQPHGGTLRMTSQVIENEVELRVLDDGPGISDEMLPKLFQPFASSKETGIGLGLVISRRIVEDHGGRMTGENRDGGGAVFTIRLPTLTANENSLST